MRFLNRTAPVRRMLGGLLALTLAFTTLGGANANRTPDEVPIYLNHPVGIVNASFGMDPNCTLNGWKTVGSVTVVPSEWGDCKAVIRASRPSGAKSSLVTSSIEQIFQINAYRKDFQLTTHLTSTNPNQTFAAQILTIYSASNDVIIRHEFNRNDQNDTRVIFDLSAYAGSQVRLKLETTVNPLVPGSPSSVSMEVYFGLLYSGPTPETIPGGG